MTEENAFFPKKQSTSGLKKKGGGGAKNFADALYGVFIVQTRLCIRLCKKMTSNWKES